MILKKFKQIFDSRFAVLFSILSLYILFSTLIRIGFLFWSSKDLDFNLFYILRAFFTGFCYDFAVGTLFLLLYSIYLLVFPKRWIGSRFDKIFTYVYLAIVLLIIYFSLLAEIPFWDEFGVRFNFIAVDYLIYTYEVISNINESYPLPLIIFVLVALIVLTFVFLQKRKIFRNTFSDKRPISKRFALFYVLIPALILSLILKNKQADFSNNLVLTQIPH